MNIIMKKLSPSATKMIRMDHTHVLAVFHKYETDTAPKVKRGLVDTVCLLLEIHAQLEEEIFYPAMRAVNPGLVEKSVPEHEEMRRLIAALRSTEPTTSGFDATFMELMRNVIRHVADEETMMLPEAERLLSSRLADLGAEMTKRRIELSAPRAGELIGNAVRAMPASTAAIGAGALVAGALIAKRMLKR